MTIKAPLCVWVCVFSFDRFLLTIYKKEPEELNMSSDQSDPLITHTHHTDIHTHTRAIWHFKNGSDGKWDCVRQSGKCQWGDCSLLLIKMHVIKREGKKELESKRKRKRGWRSRGENILLVFIFIHNVQEKEVCSSWCLCQIFVVVIFFSNGFNLCHYANRCCVNDNQL